MANIKETKGETEKMCENPFEEAGSMSDVTLVVENQKFYVNRTLLALYSPVFQRMFFSEFVEKNSNEIELPDKNHADVVNFLFQLYPVHSFRKITDETLTGILSLAEEYMVDHVRQKCQQYIQDQTSCTSSYRLTTDQVLLYLLLADRCRFTELKEELTKEAVKRTSQEISQSSHYDEVDLRVMRDILLTKSLKERKVWYERKVCNCWQTKNHALIQKRSQAEDDRIRRFKETKEKLDHYNQVIYAKLRAERGRICLYMMLALGSALADYFFNCRVV